MSWLARLPLRTAPWLAATGVVGAWLRREAGLRKAGRLRPRRRGLTPAAWDSLEPDRGRAARWPLAGIPPLGWKGHPLADLAAGGPPPPGAVAGGVTTSTCC